jgi:hypothetical protein
VFCVSVSFFFPYHGHFLFNFFLFSSLIHLSLFIVFSVSLWCLFRAHMSSLVSIISHSLFLVS